MRRHVVCWPLWFTLAYILASLHFFYATVRDAAAAITELRIGSCSGKIVLFKEKSERISL